MIGSLDQDLYDLLLYLLTSSRVAIDEPKRYGSFRLFEGFRKLLDTTRKMKELPPNEILDRLVAEIERHRDVVVSSSKVHTKEYSQFIDHLIDIMAEGAKKRLERAVE
jgi:hypothetical protein